MDSRLSVSSPRRKFIHVCVCRLLHSAGMQGLGVPCSLGLLRFAHCCRFLAAAPFLPELDVPSHHGMQTCSFFCLLLFTGDLAQYQTNKKKKLRGRVELLLVTSRPLVLFILF